jgi:hypothetical protein
VTELETDDFLGGPQSPERDALLRLIGAFIVDPQGAEAEEPSGGDALLGSRPAYPKSSAHRHQEAAANSPRRRVRRNGSASINRRAFPSSHDYWLRGAGFAPSHPASR